MKSCRSNMTFKTMQSWPLPMSYSWRLLIYSQQSTCEVSKHYLPESENRCPFRLRNNHQQRESNSIEPQNADKYLPFPILEHQSHFRTQLKGNRLFSTTMTYITRPLHPVQFVYEVQWNQTHNYMQTSHSQQLKIT